MCVWRVAGWSVAFLTLNAAILANPHLWDDLLRKRWREVTPGLLYRSGQLPASVVDSMLQRHRIRVVVDLANFDPTDPAECAEERACEREAIRQVRLPLSGDGTGDVETYAQAITEVHAAIKRGEPVLVHCRAGVQRSGGVIAAHQLLVGGVSPARVYAGLVDAGWRPARDQRLLAFLNQHLPEIAAILVERGVLDRVPNPIPILAP